MPSTTQHSYHYYEITVFSRAVIHAPSIISASPCFGLYLSFKFSVTLWENAFEYKRTPHFCSTSLYKRCVYDCKNTVDGFVTLELGIYLHHQLDNIIQVVKVYL